MTCLPFAVFVLPSTTPSLWFSVIFLFATSGCHRLRWKLLRNNWLMKKGFEFVREWLQTAVNGVKEHGKYVEKVWSIFATPFNNSQTKSFVNYLRTCWKHEKLWGKASSVAGTCKTKVSRYTEHDASCWGRYLRNASKVQIAILNTCVASRWKPCGRRAAAVRTKGREVVKRTHYTK